MLTLRAAPRPVAAPRASRRPVTVAASSSSSSSSAARANFDRVVARLVERRERMEQLRAKQLWRIANAIDDIAREEVTALNAGSPDTPDAHAPDAGSIDVEFVDPVQDVDADA